MNTASADMVLVTRIVIGIYMLITLGFVIRGALKTKSISDYALGNVTFPPFAVGLALSAAMTSAATFIINPGFIAYYGLSAVLSFAIVLPLAAMGSLIFLTYSYRRHGIAVKAQTMAQWMGTRYNSDGYKLFFAFLSLLLITFIVLICVGLTKVLAHALDVSEMNVLIGIVVFIFGYMMFGGANSMVYTNTIQAILMLIVAVILLGSGYEHFSGGVNGFIEKLKAIDPKLVQSTNDSSFLFRDYFEIIFTQVIVGIAIVCQPHIITKSMLIKSDSGVKRFLTVAVISQIIFFFVVFTGLYARIMFPDLTFNGKPINLDSVIPTYVVQEFPVYFGILVVLGLISAGISTLEGLIQSISTTATVDIFERLFGKYLPADEVRRGKSLITVNKIMIAVFGIIAVYLSHEQLTNPKLSVGIFAQNGVYAYFSAAFVPILMGLFIKSVPKVAPIAASVTAIGVHFTMYYGKLGVPFTKATGENPGVAASMAILASVIVGFTVYYLSREKVNA
ncbi:MAG: sodium:solute symporter [Ignavibacteriaceae bacterium]|nr:sodium:solute symporter [Ignavibacteriaceae bacterium]